MASGPVVGEGGLLAAIFTLLLTMAPTFTAGGAATLTYSAVTYAATDSSTSLRLSVVRHIRS